MPSISLKEPSFESYDLGLERDNRLPREMRIRLRVKYDKAILKKGEDEVEMNHILGLGAYVVNSDGYLEFKSSVSQESVSIRCRIQGVWQSDIRRLDIVSYPLSHKDISELDQLEGDQLQIRWSVNCLVLLDKPMNYGLEPGTPVSMDVHTDKIFEISRLDLIRRILEPADQLKRRFVEVIVEPISSEELSKIPDADIRDTLRFLLNKQKILEDALDRLVRASKSSDYKSTIEDVRDVIEGLTSGTPEGSKLFRALKKAFKGLGVVEASDPTALDQAIEELVDDSIGKISGGVFSYTSVFVHTTTSKGRLSYIPKPHKHDAKFVVLQAMIFLDYLIRVLKAYTQRL